MIEIIKKKSKKIKPHYKLQIYYMIGDADGDIVEETKVSLDNPYLEKILIILDKLKPVNGNGGIRIESNSMYESYLEGQINKDEYLLVNAVFFEKYDNVTDTKYNLTNNSEYLWEFEDMFYCETEYSYLSYVGYDLKYIDENGVKYKTKIIN